jgi:hypothetical protein
MSQRDDPSEWITAALTLRPPLFTLASKLGKVCFAGFVLFFLFNQALAHAQEAKPPAPMPLAPWLLHAKLKHQVDPELLPVFVL